MAGLITEPNLPAVDDIYAQLIAMYDGLSVEESLTVAARLNLILVNHVGDPAVVAAAIAAARRRPDQPR